METKPEFRKARGARFEILQFRPRLGTRSGCDEAWSGWVCSDVIECFVEEEEVEKEEVEIERLERGCRKNWG